MKQLFALFAAAQLALAGAGDGAFPLRLEPAEPVEPSAVLLEETAPAASVPALQPEAETETEPDTTTITMTFSGDVLLASLLDRTTAGSFNEYAGREAPSYFLRDAAPIFQADDFTLVNLENALSDRALEPRDKGEGTAFWFKSKTDNTEILTSSGVEAVSLVNNHTHDYGSGGYRDTVKAVEAAGLAYGTESEAVYFEKGGFQVAVLCAGLWSESGADAIVRRLKAEEGNSDFQIVFFHGGAEGVHTPERWKQRAARKLVDNGADLVLGAHPHVLQPMEVYNGVDIVYSLGNFCFGGNRRPENRTALYQLTLTVDRDRRVVGKESRLIPFYVYTGEQNNYRPAPITDEAQAQKVLDFMAWRENSPV